jgi:hypothetical protein
MWSAVAMLCVMAPAPTAAQEALRHRVSDPVSGAEVRVYRTEPGTTRFDVSDDRVTVAKTVSAGRSQTTIRTGAEEISIVMAPGVLRVEGTRGTDVLGVGDRAGSERVSRRLAGSSAVREALGLLARVSSRSASPIAHAVLSTRVVLSRLSGNVEAGAAMARSVHRVVPERLMRVSLAADGPGECWDEYVEEAIDTYIEYENCVDDTDWWNLAGLAGCLTIYEMRAIGAFSWWMSCVALRG